MIDKVPQTPLPNKLSDLLLLALRDLKACEKHPDYRIEMGTWHSPYQGKCYVCLAGAVMANSLRIPANQYQTPYSLNRKIMKKLLALENIRRGLISDTLTLFVNSKLIPKIPPINLSPLPIYAENPRLFHENMKKIVKILQKHGY